jgi:hypothetical protein
MKKSWEAWWRPNLIEIGKLFYLFSLLTFPRLSGTVSRKKLNTEVKHYIPFISLVFYAVFTIRGKICYCSCKGWFVYSFKFTHRTQGFCLVIFFACYILCYFYDSWLGGYTIITLHVHVHCSRLRTRTKTGQCVNCKGHLNLKFAFDWPNFFIHKWPKSLFMIYGIFFAMGYMLLLKGKIAGNRNISKLEPWKCLT